MRASLFLLPAAALTASLAAAEPVTPGPAAKSHANTVSGTVVSVQDGEKKLVVRDARGKETRLVWTTATRMSGGALKAGEKVTVRWMRRDGKNIATALKVVGGGDETNASGSTPSPISPTPKSP